MSRTIERRSRRERLALRAWPPLTGTQDYRLTSGAVPLVLLVFMAGTLLLLAGCGGGGGGSSDSGNPPPPPPPAFNVGGSVTGLNGAGLTLRLNGGRDLTISAAGNFTFSGTLAGGSAYAVTVGAQPTNPHQTCAVSNGSGTVAAANVTDIAVACTTNSYAVGGSAQGVVGSGLVLQNNDGDSLTVNADGAFVFATAVPSGATYEVSIARQPSNPLQACRITNGSGAVAGTAITNVSIACEGIVPRFAYVTNLLDNTVSTYRVEDATGQLRHHGYALTGKGPRGLAIDPSLRFAYVANQASDDVSAFAIDRSTGTLASIAGSPFRAGDAPQAVVAHPGGRLLHVVNQLSGDVSVFRIEATGSLTALGTSSAGAEPVALAFGPKGRVAYVANGSSNSVSAYLVNPATGELKPISGSPFAAGEAPAALEIDREGRFLYVANADSKNVSAFAIDAAGALVPVSGSPFPADDGPFAIALDPTGRFAYVSNRSSSNVSAYEIDRVSGAFNELGGSPFPARDRPEGMHVDASGRYLYVATAGSDTVITYHIERDGALQSPRTVVARDNPGAITVVTGPGAVRVVPKFAYAVNTATDDVTTLAIDVATGALSRIGAEVPSGEFPVALTTDPAARFVYVANRSADTVTTFGVDSASGALAAAGALVPTGNAPVAIASDVSGRFAFVLNAGDDTIETFAMNATTGALTSLGATSALAGDAELLVVHPSGRFVYTLNEDPDTVRTFRVDAATGRLTEVGTGVATREEPLAISIDAAGQFLYVSTNRNAAKEHYLAVMRIDAGTGVPAEIDALASDDGMYGAAVDPSGRYLCVTENLTGLVVTRAIDQATGELSTAGTIVDVGSGPTRIEFEGSGRFAYVVVGDLVAALALDPATGALTRVGTDAATGRSPAAIAIANRVEFE